MTDQAQTRRLQDTLTIAGSGVIAFSVWSFAKIGLFLKLVDQDALRGMLGLTDDSLMGMVYLLPPLLALADLAIRAYVGLSARAEGRGKKKGPFYLVVAALAAIANATSLFVIMQSTTMTSYPLNTAVSIIIEATAAAALVVVIYSSLRFRHMSKTTE